MTRNIELPTQLERPPNESTGENIMPGSINDIRKTCAKKILGLLVSFAAGSALVGCAESKYITRERRDYPETTKREALKNAESAVNCSTGEKKCDDGKYFLCVHIEGNCSCRDEEKTKETCKSRKDGSENCSTSTTTERVCGVSDVSVIPQNIEELVGEPIEWYQADALQCSQEWDSPTGFKKGSLWANIPSEDRRCRPEKPIE